VLWIFLAVFRGGGVFRVYFEKLWVLRKGNMKGIRSDLRRIFGFEESNVELGYGYFLHVGISGGLPRV